MFFHPVISFPSRVCLEIPMHENCIFFLECQAIDCSENVKVEPPTIKTLHVQGISHWAPANIGPYSQAKKVWLQFFTEYCLSSQMNLYVLFPPVIYNTHQVIWILLIIAFSLLKITKVFYKTFSFARSSRAINSENANRKWFIMQRDHC